MPERRFRKASIKDVARHAGVSTTTVSVFVSGRESVCSPETAERIRAAVAALHYTPSSLISGAQKKITRTVGVCMLSPLDPGMLYGSLFFERLWRGITSQTDIEDYSILHYPASVREATHDRVDAFLDGRVDGVLFHSHENVRPAHVAAAGMPTVLLTRSLRLPEGSGAVYADETQTIDIALSHLWEQGHRRIAHIAGPVGHESQTLPGGSGFLIADDVAVQRLRAYQDWMRVRDVYDPELVFFADSWRGDASSGAVPLWRRMPDRPTAVVCANDALAVAVIGEVSRQGWRIPEDLSVIGIDNSPDSGAGMLPLTTVEIGLEQIGRESVQCLLRLMAGAPLEACRVGLPVASLVSRETVAPPYTSR
jgi:DNA-binding LacI/PurR family transcriptional regulator